MIRGGYIDDQIAPRLVLTPGIVANHVDEILRRLDLDSRTKVPTLTAELSLHRQIVWRSTGPRGFEDVHRMGWRATVSSPTLGCGLRHEQILKG